MNTNTVPVLSRLEILKLTVRKPFSARCWSAAKGAVYAPAFVGIGGLLSPLAALALARNSFSGATSTAAALGNFAAGAMAVGCCIAGVAVYGTIIFGGPLALPVLGGILGASALVGAGIGYSIETDDKATHKLQAPYWNAFHERQTAELKAKNAEARQVLGRLER